MSARFITFGQPPADLGQVLPQLHPMGATFQSLRPAVEARAAELLLVERRGAELVAGSRLAVIGPELHAAIMVHLRDALQAQTDWLKQSAVPLLAAVWQEMQPDHGWDQVVHTVVAGLFLDVGVRQAVIRAALLDDLPDGFYVLAFLGGTGAYNAFGVKTWWNADEPFGVSHVWHRDIPRPATFFPADVRTLRALGQGTGEGLLDPAALLRLRYFGLVAPFEPRLVIPSIRLDPADRLMQTVTRLSDQLVDVITRPLLLRLDPLWSDVGTARRTIYRQAVLRLALEHGADMAIGAGLMPPFPKAPPKGWGSWLWEAAEGSEFLIHLSHSVNRGVTA
jgi:hypothetical protein